MPIFLYKGYDALSGAARKGKVEADSIKSARQRLRTKDKIIASEIREEIAVQVGRTTSSLFQKKVALDDLAIMTRQFATLQQAHVPLDECLKALTQQVENDLLRNTLSAIKDLVSEGKSLGESLSNFPDIFNRLYVNMVKAGESSGSLGLVLERLSDFLEYQVAVRGKVFTAMAYPSLMMGASLLVIAYLFISVIPKLEKVFSNLKVSLPWYSTLLINTSRFVQRDWYIILIAIVLLYFAIKRWYETEKGRETWDRWSLTLPLFGPIILRVNISAFTKTLSTLLSSGVPIINAIEITRNVISNRVIADVLVEAKKAVQEGEPLYAVIEKSKRFPPLVVHMIRTGERSGELEPMLQHVAKAYDAEVERRIDTFIAIIEPVMIIVMAGVVVSIVLAMLVPMMSAMSQVR